MLNAVCDRRQSDRRLGHGHGPDQLEYKEIEFIPLDWLKRAAWCPGLIVYSRPILVPIHGECRRQIVRRQVDQSIDRIEQLLREALLPTTTEVAFLSIDL